MKKILYVTTIAGFLPQFELNDVRIIQQMGYEVHYASNFNNPVYAFDIGKLKTMKMILHQIDVAKNPFNFLANYKAMIQIKKIIDEEEIHLVHCHNPMGGVAARIAAQISRQKPSVIYTAHGFHFYKGAPFVNWMAFFPVERLLAHYTDAIVTINGEDYARAKKVFRLKEGGFIKRIHGAGVDTERFQERPETGLKKRRELGIPEDAFHIVTAAELNRNKNQKVIIEAMARIKRSNIYYSICGKGRDERKLRKLIRKRGLEGKVKLHGFRTDMEEILQTADVFAFPSYREGLGIAAVEALLCGVPVIAADNRGSREYIKNGVNGIFCEADDVEAFAEAIDRLYQDRSYRDRLAGQCREHAVKFGTEETMKIMKGVYEEVDSQIS